jgi:DNA polymerase sigma
MHRDIILSSIEFLLQQMYPEDTDNINIYMCGSIMNGLALDTSDMDLVVYGLRVANRANL